MTFAKTASEQTTIIHSELLMLAGLLAGVFIASIVMTGAIRHYALSRQILDVPNHRSSHAIPTPRGGGLAFVICFLMIALMLLVFKFINLNNALAILGSGLVIAAIGLIDDHQHIPAKPRLFAHFMACIFAVVALGGMPSVSVLGWSLPTGFFINGLAVFYLVWLLNLYNFMDGIDGIAAIESMSVCLGGAFLYWWLGVPEHALLPLVLAFAVAGFLYWNFPPARIFMGDSGSGFLGITLGVMSIYAASVKPQLFWSWLILLAVFIVDATVTLLYRGLKGEKLMEAHCSHAYQHASRHVGSHLFVTLMVLLINGLWLFPLAFLVGIEAIDGFTGLLIACFPLMILALYLGAGQILRD